MAGKPDMPVYRPDITVPKDFSDFNPPEVADSVCKWAERKAGSGKVAMSVSGGVDSTVASFLFREVFGDRLYPFFVDDGLRRIIGGEEEYEVTMRMFRDFPNFDLVDTSSIVPEALEGISEGRLKRETMISHYVRASNGYFKAIGAGMLGDGTIKPDIETTKAGRQRQHNVDIKYEVPKLEPLAALYKPQVRRLGEYLGLSPEFVHQIPCPGPATLLRVGGLFNEKKLELAKRATDVVERAVERYCKGIWGEPYRFEKKTGVRTPFQYFAYSIDPGMIPIKGCVNKVLSDAAGFRGLNTYVTETKAMWIDSDVEQQERELYEGILWIDSMNRDDLGFKDMVRVSHEADKLGFPRTVFGLAYSGREDGYPVAIKVVESSDAQTAKSMDISTIYLQAVAEKIIRDYGATMVGYEVSTKPRASIELF
jgi:GMP synthase (glutamine-hydrolysing)